MPHLGRQSRKMTHEAKKEKKRKKIDYSFKWKDILRRTKSVTVHGKGRKVFTKEGSTEAFLSRHKTSTDPKIFP